jgi:endogenous inhibitor of DNA gyrase (YacG/DUF329 family)
LKKKAAKKQIVGYESHCPSCGNIFEEDIRDVGKDPVSMTCANCGKDIDRGNIEPIYETKKKELEKANDTVKKLK